jgi:uncharacterized membrane protein
MTKKEYIELLEKYIRYIDEAEGSDSIKYGKEPFTGVSFTEKEWDKLREISKKVNQIS